MSVTTNKKEDSQVVETKMLLLADKYSRKDDLVEVIWLTKNIKRNMNIKVHDLTI